MTKHRAAAPITSSTHRQRHRHGAARARWVAPLGGDGGITLATAAAVNGRFKLVVFKLVVLDATGGNQAAGCPGR
jgi:hypothetical protein